MYTKIRLIIKKKFPSIYSKIRDLLFPYISNRNKNIAKNFTETTTKTVNIHGVTYQIQLNPENGFVDTTIYTDGAYEPDILLVIKDNLPKGGTFIDIGANIGNHTLFAAKHVGDGGKVISFEPIPRIAQQFEQSINLNQLKNISLHKFACSDTVSEARLTLVKGNIGGSSLHRADKENSINIETRPADSVLHNLNRVDLIKIDTEGHELEALKGLQKTLAEHQPTLIIEFSPFFWGEERQNKSNEFFNLLEKFNYRLYDLEEGHSEIKQPLVWIKTFTKQQTNLLCIVNKN